MSRTLYASAADATPQSRSSYRVHAHLVQLNIAWEDKPRNFTEVERLISLGEVAPGDLIVLPEMFDTGFSTNLGATVDHDDLTLSFLKKLAKTTRAIVHGARTCLAADGRGRNLATVVHPDGRVLCEYQKTYLFPLGDRPESETFAPGSGLHVYDWTPASGSSVTNTREDSESIRVCPTICYDLRFPELYRRGLDLGAQLFTVTSSWPRPREAHRRALSIARAIENQAYVLSVNRCGQDPNLEYAGGTLAIGPRGDVLGELADGPGVLRVEVAAREVRRWRELFPAWKDRRREKQ